MQSERPAHDPNLGDECECFRCHVGSLTLGLPKDYPTRTYSRAAPRGSSNSWENGVPTSRRNGGTEMPYLRSDGEVMRVKEFGEKSHRIKENKERAKAGLPLI